MKQKEKSVQEIFLKQIEKSVVSAEAKYVAEMKLN